MPKRYALLTITQQPPEDAPTLCYIYENQASEQSVSPQELDEVLHSIGTGAQEDLSSAGRRLHKLLMPPSLGGEGGAERGILDRVTRHSIPWEWMCENNVFWGTQYALSYAVGGAREYPGLHAATSLVMLTIEDAPNNVRIGERVVQLSGLAKSGDGLSFFAPLTKAASAAFPAQNVAHFYGQNASAVEWTAANSTKPGHSIVLYAGHLVYDDASRAYLVLNNDKFQPDADALSNNIERLLAHQHGQATLVVLCACGPDHSVPGQHAGALAERLLQGGARGVILAERPVAAEDARDFLTLFFEALYEDQGRHPVAECLRKARQTHAQRHGAPTANSLAFRYYGPHSLRIRVAVPKKQNDRCPQISQRIWIVLCATLLALFILTGLLAWSQRSASMPEINTTAIPQATAVYSEANPPAASESAESTPTMAATATPDLQEGAAEIDKLSMDWNLGLLTLHLSAPAQAQSVVCLLRVSGHYYLKPTEQHAVSALVDGATRQELQIFIEPTDRKASEVVVYLMKSKDAHAQDFRDAGQVYLGPPDYVAQTERVLRKGGDIE